MKLRTISLRWMTASLLLTAVVAPRISTAGEKLGTAFLLRQQQRAIQVQPKPLQERRVPAFKRIETGFVPYLREGNILTRHDETSSRVMAFNILCSRNKPRLRAGHSFAPNLNRIVRRR